MEKKTIFQRKTNNDDESLFIGPHETCFLDKKFYENFQDTDGSLKPVEI